MIYVIIAWSLSFFFSYMFACRGHFAAYWGSVVDIIAQCFNIFELIYALSISDVITDAIILLFPLPMVCATWE